MLQVSSATGTPGRVPGVNEGGSMNLLSGTERDSLRMRLIRMPNPVHLLVFTRAQGRRGIAARQLGRELQALSRTVHLELHDVDANPLLAAYYGVRQTPAIALFTGGVIIADTRIRFYGLPEGPVLEALVDGIVAVSQGSSIGTLAPDRRTRSLDRPVHLDVYVPCPAATDSQVLLRLQRLALLSAQLSFDVMSGEDAPGWARHADGADTVLIVVNDAIVLRGSEERLLDDLEAATWGEPERLDLESRSRAFPVGGHGTGASAVDDAVPAV